MSAISTLGLRKAYGAQVALAGVDFEVPSASVYGLVGPNGSGKTTLLEVLAGLRRRSAGEVHLAAGPDAVAYCPDVAEFEPWLSAIEVLDVAAGLLGRRRPRRFLAEVLDRVGLADAAARRVGGFSRGMTTRLNLASALVGEPEILLLDEPASSLDPAGRVGILALVASLGEESTVVVSSHDLAEVEAVCDHVGILAAGHFVYQGQISGLLACSAAPRWQVMVRPPAARLLAALTTASWVSEVTETAPGEIELRASDPDQVETQLPRLLADTEARVVSLRPLRPSLEEAFLALTAAPGHREAQAS